jgi:hypothetical protein
MLRGTPSGLIAADVPTVDLFQQAVLVCSRRHGYAPDEVLRRLEAGDREVHSTFRYGVAKELGAYLASLGSIFHEVYVYGSAIGDVSGPASDIDLIVVVATRRDELTSFLKRLDLALVSGYRRLVRMESELTSLLDVRIVDQREQEERSGYSAVIDGLHTRPICLWRSKPATTGALRKEGPRRSFVRSSGVAAARMR